MNPRLVAIAGPLNGRVVPLTEAEFSIGRFTSNQLSVNHPSVSRRHCLIKKENEQFRILDLDSRNSTFVNGVPVKECALHHGDTIKVGASYFLFLLLDEDVAATKNSIQLDDSELISGSTISLMMEDALYLQPEKLAAAIPPTARLAHHLNVLLKISTVINSIQSVEALGRKLLELTFEAVPAERGAFLLAGENSDQFASVFGWDRLAGPEFPVQVSRTIVQRVLREGVAILANNRAEDQAFSSATSFIAARIESVLCVPLIVFKKVLGAIYLDTKDPQAQFEEDHLQLMTAIAASAALSLKHVLQMEWLENENRRLQADIDIQHDMVGGSPQLREVHQFIAKVAPTDSTVLITGESGTGKELVARAIHRNSKRADKPFVAINCAALIDTLLESELFGHERGAFTGAVAQKKGKLEVADGGTIFLDEMGELAPALQAKLLRFLQEHEFERVGGTRPIKVDIRLIAATNKDLGEAIQSGSFRRDLYYRINVVSVTMPPLRERREDIPLLVNYFAVIFSEKSKRKVVGVSDEARACLLAYDWPGNIRELANAIERAVVLGSSDLILPEDLPEAVLEARSPTGISGSTYYEAIIETKKQLILRALDQAKGNYIDAAKLLGMHVNYLHRLIKNLNLKQAITKGH
jgi:transcriptional regulator with GAF, ATPase, and Fis domain